MLFFRLKKPVLSAELKLLLENAEIRAREYSHDYVGVEHAFLCLRNLPDSAATATVLKCLPVDRAAFWEDLERQAKVVTGRPVPSILPRTPRLNKVLELAQLWAARGKQLEVTLLHFLGGVAHERNSLVAHVFRSYFKRQNPDYTNQDAMG